MVVVSAHNMLIESLKSFGHRGAEHLSEQVRKNKKRGTELQDATCRLKEFNQGYPRLNEGLNIDLEDSLFGSPYVKDYSISGSILGPPNYEEPSFRLQQNQKIQALHGFHVQNCQSHHQCCHGQPCSANNQSRVDKGIEK